MMAIDAAVCRGAQLVGSKQLRSRCLTGRVPPFGATTLTPPRGVRAVCCSHTWCNRGQHCPARTIVPAQLLDRRAYTPLSPCLPLAMTSRAALAAPLLLQTPPGQLPNVYEDLVGLVKSEGDNPQADEDEFQKLAIRVRADHNLEQHIVVDLPGGKGKSILSPAAAHPSEHGRFFAPREGCSFVVDHETLVSCCFVLHCSPCTHRIPLSLALVR